MHYEGRLFVWLTMLKSRVFSTALVMFRMQLPIVQAQASDSRTWRHPELAHPVQPRRRVQRANPQRLAKIWAQLPRRRALRILVRTAAAAALATPRQEVSARMY